MLANKLWAQKHKERFANLSVAAAVVKSRAGWEGVWALGFRVQGLGSGGGSGGVLA